MNRRHNLELVVCLSLAMVSSPSADVSAYEIETHQKLSEKAAMHSDVDGRLKESLAFSTGLDLRVRGQTLQEWIGIGSMHADDWTYFLNHFHNPLAASWSEAGFPFGQSTILWGQNPTQGYPS